jgi:hypothetical protein
MPLNLRHYNLKPNSNYNVSITVKKGDRVIDGLRSVYVSTPKYLTTNIENTTTTSTIIFDRSYQRNTLTEPSVEVTLPIPGKNASTEIKQWGVSLVKAPFDATVKNVAIAKVGKVWVKGPNVDKNLTITVRINADRTYNGPVTLQSSHPNLRWFNQPLDINIKSDNEITLTLTPRQMDPSVYWQAYAKGGAWISTPLSVLKKGFNPPDNTTSISYQVHHPPVAAVPGSTKQIPGVYQDVQGLIQTLKTSVQNQDLISQLYWDDVDEPDAIRDVIHFLFRDDTADTDAVLTNMNNWIYLDDYFVAASPSATGTTYVQVSGRNLSKTPPELDLDYLNLSEPIISSTKTVYQTTSLFESLQTPTQVRVAFTIVRYKKNSNGTWTGSWLKTIPSGTFKDYPVLSSPEVLSGSS